MVVKARVQGAWNLHNSLLTTPLDFFVMLASLTGIIGNRGQAAYAASNTFMDSFANYRTLQGLPASTIDIGVVAGVGYVAEHKSREAQIRSVAHDLLNEKELLALVKTAINFESKEDAGDLNSHQILAGCKLVPDLATLWWAADPKFSHLLRATEDSAVSSPGSKGSLTTISIREYLKQAQSSGSGGIHTIIETALISKIAALSMIPQEEIEVEKPLAAYGMDLLVAVEIRNWIANEIAANIPALEFIASSTIRGLVKVVMSKSALIEKKGGDRKEGE